MLFIFTNIWKIRSDAGLPKQRGRIKKTYYTFIPVAMYAKLFF